MPLIETDLLKAFIDPEDALHAHAVKAYELLSKKDYVLSSVSFIELDLILKSSGFSGDEREEIFHTLYLRLIKARLAELNAHAVQNAARLQSKYDAPRFYFDSLHLGLAMCHDSRIISSDKYFDSVDEVTRIDPADL